MFDQLSERLGSVFRGIRGRGRITEANVRESMREVRTALLEADVHVEVARQFCDECLKKALGLEVLNTLRPEHVMVKVVHDELADEHGYHVFRILQNAATFGLPQWRPRFWCIFLRKDIADRFAVWHQAKCVTLEQVLSDDGDGEPDAELERRLEVQKQYLTEAGFDDAAIGRIFNTPGFMSASIAKQHPDFAKDRGIENDIQQINKAIAVGGHESVNPLKITKPGYAYRTKTIRVLDPEGTSGVVFGGAWWMYKGRNVTPLEYRRIMGFPDDYKLDGWYKQWLSKGVCPPVAEWISQLLNANADGEIPVEAGARWLNPGETCDLGITRHVHRLVATGDLEPSRAFDTIVPKSGTTAPRTRTTKAPRKRRVIRSYYFICPDEIPQDLVELCFKPKKDDLVCEPLHSLEERDDGFKAVIQYEPPNIGGHRGDVERIAKRVAKKLADAGYTVEYTDEGPWMPPAKEDA